jgi:diguanylate cyclase (GGDEF)-like protein
MVFIQLVDETQRVSAERDLLRTRADLLDAQEMAGVGSFEGNIHTGEFTWSPQLRRLFGYTPEQEEKASFRTIFGHFHVEDRKRFAHAFMSVVRDGVPRTLEGRVVAVDGTERYVRASARRLMMDGRIIGTVQDLSEIHRQHEEIVQSEALMRAIVNSMQAGLTLLSPEAEIVFYNDAALRMIGIEQLPSGDYRSPGVVEVVNSAGVAIDHSDRPGIVALDQGKVCQNVELGYVMRDGTTKWLNVNAAPVVSTEDNAVLGAVSTFVDVSVQREQKRMLEEQVNVANRLASMLEKKNKQLSRANQRLHQMATTDGLTGLTNHRAFQEFLEKYYHQAVRTGAPLSIMLIDVDHFKAFNDTFGHQEGDYVLRQLARIFQRSARKGDVVARYGGEEFCIILVNADPTSAVQVAERLRERVATTPWRLRKVTVSIGLSTLEQGMNNQSELVERADAALYASKRSGRDRVTHSQSLPRAA